MPDFTKYSIPARILFREKMMLNRITDSWNTYVDSRMSRDDANQIRKRLVSNRGRKIIDKKLDKKIKAYCRKAFGSSSYWPWIALYTELRGEFKEGWMPDDYYRFRLLPKVNPEKFMKFSEAKTIDYKLFNESIVAPIIFRTNGRYYNKGGTFKEISEVRKILDSIKGEVIIKPADGHSGKEIMFKKSKEIKLEELPEETDLVIQKVVSQHPELQKLYPYSVNTFRVMTYLGQDGSVEVKFIINRFGRAGIRVDNASSGGAWIYVNLDGTVETFGYDFIGNKIGQKHPDTHIQYSELKFPFIDKVISFCKEVHLSFPYVRIVGWDVFVDENEEPKLIEWNANNPFFNVIEAHFGPYFADLLEY